MSSGDQLSVLVAGIGNRDRGDDAVGPAVARRLRGRVRSGISVLELGGDALGLIEHWRGFSSVIIVDAVAPITKPGQVHRLDLTNNPLPVTFALRSTHAFGLAETVELARGLGRLPLFVVAHLVEGEQFETGAPLSPAVAGAVEEAVERIMIELSEIREPLKRKEPPVMHEVALVRDVVRCIEDLSRATSARRVTGAKVWLGALSHLSAGHFREHFTIEARDTLAGGAVL